MPFFGQKRTVKVDENYSQIAELTSFWHEMRQKYPEENLLGLGANLSGVESIDYYIGKIGEALKGASDSLEIPDEGWEEFNCKLNDKEIEKMYRNVYKQGTPDYEIESMTSDTFTTKVHFEDKGEKA